MAKEIKKDLKRKTQRIDMVSLIREDQEEKIFKKRTSSNDSEFQNVNDLFLLRSPIGSGYEQTLPKCMPEGPCLPLDYKKIKYAKGPANNAYVYD